MMESRLKEVLEYLLTEQKVVNITDFAKQIAKGQSYVSEALNGKRTITPKFIKQITDTFPQINGNWILTGEGDMVISGDVNIENRVNSHNVEVRASGNSNVSINNRGSAETQSLRAKVEILERQNVELQRLLAEEKERSQKYWQMIEKLTNN